MNAPLPAAGNLRKYFGVVPAIVLNNIDDDGEGKVLVRFTWSDGDSDPQWCRVCQFYAGPQAVGAFFVPEISSEVLVAFVNSDVSSPVVIGSLYNGVDKPSTARTESLDQKQIRTRSGHVVLLDDTDGQEKIVIVDKTGSLSITLDCTASSIAIRSEGGSLKLEADDIEIKAQKSYRLEAATVEETASGKFVVKGSTK